MKESKNNTMFKLLSYILLQKGLEMVGVCMSRVGHTHGCLGTLVVRTTICVLKQVTNRTKSCLLIMRSISEISALE